MVSTTKRLEKHHNRERKHRVMGMCEGHLPETWGKEEGV